jgi:hypothetical protein
LFLVKKQESTKHRGEYLKAAVKRSGFKISALTEAAKYDRSSYYNHIADPFLPIRILHKYSKVLKEDFSKDFPEIKDFEERTSAITITTFEEMEADRDFWKEKYFDLVDKLANYSR